MGNQKISLSQLRMTPKINFKMKMCIRDSMMNEATFGSDDSFMTVGEMSSTTIDNCVLYSAPERQELSMAFNLHQLKVDYEDGQKWTIAPFDFCLLYTSSSLSPWSFSQFGKSGKYFE